ncbi:ABC transporter substrate-binding protein [Actinopolymorpha alba]|uniref:ABC transporter substrate-binding protein n=1 Tax=Actinopolymorpha alba TaxID=533267 RepID=UPI00037F1970|nr:ABC transporter substrate-binding protein [Actinopolymorpha alba]
MRLYVGIGLAAAIAMSLAACSTPGDGQTSRGPTDASSGAGSGGTMRVAIASDPGTLDPTLANTFEARVVFTSFCEKLYDASNSLKIVPQLAADLPKTSADGLTVTIALRSGVKFNDGTAFDASAVKTSLDRHLTLEGSARTRELAAVKSVDVVDPTTLRINLRRPFSPLGAQLADRAGLIMSPTALKKLGKNFGNSPVCVGPFTWAGRTAGSEIKFTKSNDYYDASKVRLRGVTYRIITDDNARAANLQSGDVDVAEQLDSNDIPRLKADSNLTVKDISAISYQGISINIGNTQGIGKPSGTIDTPLGRNPELRKAFEMALDRDAMNEVVYNGANAVDCLPFPMQSEFRPEKPACTPYDPAQAKKLVQASGEKTPIPVDLMIPAGSGADRLAQVIQSMAEKVGFAVRIKPQEFISALAAARAGKFDTFLIGWSGRVDPDGNISDLVTSGGSNNFSGVSDPQLDELATDAAAASATKERAAIYVQTLERLKEIRSNIYLYHDRWFLGFSKEVTGVAYPADGIPRFKSASFTP